MYCNTLCMALFVVKFLKWFGHSNTFRCTVNEFGDCIGCTLPKTYYKLQLHQITTVATDICTHVVLSVPYAVWCCRECSSSCDQSTAYWHWSYQYYCPTTHSHKHWVSSVSGVHLLCTCILFLHFRIVQQTSSTLSADKDSSSSSSPWLLIVCVFISILFNIIFLAVIVFAYKKKLKKHRQLTTHEGLSYRRVNNDSDSENFTIESAMSSPTSSGHNNSDDDDDPMIDL